MDPTLATVLGVFMRWVHIISVVILIGGLFYARGIGTTISPWFRPKIWIGLGGILVSGTYNLLTKSSVPPMYHMWFGIKMLLALHFNRRPQTQTGLSPTLPSVREVYVSR